MPDFFVPIQQTLLDIDELHAFIVVPPRLSEQHYS